MSEHQPPRLRIAFRDRVARARREERRRLRRELHDGIGGSLAGVSIMVGAAARGAPDLRTAGVLRDVELTLRSISGELRALVDDMRPPPLDELGLVGAIRQRAAGFGACAALAVHVHEHGLGGVALPAAVEVAVYRIATEAMTNVVRHAGATTCRLDLICDGVRLALCVIDDGNGMLAPREGGIGLGSMCERAVAEGGEFAWHATPGAGVRVWCSLPLQGA